MKPSAPPRTNDASPRPRRTQRDPEDDDDDEPERPFPRFLPSDAEIIRQKRIAKLSIKEMVEGLKPVVPFNKPLFVRTRPPWCSSTAVKRPQYTPMLQGPSESPQTERQSSPLPPLTQPKWVNIIPRVVSGCPQLGLVLVNEADAHQSLPKHMKRRLRRILDRPQPQPNTTREYGHVAELTQASALTPRFMKQSKQDITLEFLKDPKVYRSIRDAVLSPSTPRRTADRKSVLVSLPRIGVRLFAIAPKPRAPESARREPSNGGSPVQPICN